MSYPKRSLFAVLTLMLMSACTIQPAEGREDWRYGAMATTANPYATDAAIVMLEQGGHAVDAGIAAHLVLGLVEPQSSGIGGGGFMLVYERVDQSLRFHDGRETHTPRIPFCAELRSLYLP